MITHRQWKTRSLRADARRHSQYYNHPLANIEQNRNSLAWLRNPGFYFTGTWCIVYLALSPCVPKKHGRCSAGTSLQCHHNHHNAPVAYYNARHIMHNKPCCNPIQTISWNAMKLTLQCTYFAPNVINTIQCTTHALECNVICTHKRHPSHTYLLSHLLPALLYQSLLSEIRIVPNAKKTLKMGCD
jgi:hypothetical protein